MRLNRYIGAPYADHGRGPFYDCWGLVQAVYRDQMGIALPSYDDRYFAAGDRHVAETIAVERRRWLAVADPQPGDVIVLRINGRPQHVGVVVGGGEMIHALRGCDVCIESYDTPMWSKRIDGFYRYR